MSFCHILILCRNMWQLATGLDNAFLNISIQRELKKTFYEKDISLFSIFFKKLSEWEKLKSRCYGWNLSIRRRQSFRLRTLRYEVTTLVSQLSKMDELKYTISFKSLFSKWGKLSDNWKYFNYRLLLLLRSKRRLLPREHSFPLPSFVLPF